MENWRSDRGGEFIDGDLQKWLKTRGFRHETTPSNTPQGNAITKRMNRTLQDRARSMLQHMLLPPGLWAEAISLASYLRNRCQVCGLSKTLEEFWSSVVPKIDHLQSFGCKVYVRLEKQGKMGSSGMDWGTGCLEFGKPMSSSVGSCNKQSPQCWCGTC